MSQIYVTNLLLQKGYSDIRYINKGSYGTVYKCLNKENLMVAIKVVEVNNFEEINNGLLEAFHLIKLKHSNIVKVNHVFLLCQNILVIEMELLEFGNLYYNFIKNKIGLSESVILQILQQACSALQYLKENNVIHRDLKLENILIKHVNLQKEEIEIVIIDFGLVKSVHSEFSISLKGTIGYLAPELLENNDDIKLYSFKSDIFALGVTLYKLISFDTITDISQLYYNLNNDEQVMLKLKNSMKNNNLNILYSDNLINLVIKMLERNPNIRYSAEQISNEITTILQSITLLKHGYCNNFEFIKMLENGFKYPIDIKKDEIDNLIYIVDRENYRISIFNSNFEFKYNIYVPDKPLCICLDSLNNNIIISCFSYSIFLGSYNVIYKYSKDGKKLSEIKNEFNCVTDIAMDKLSGELYLCDSDNNRILIYTNDFKLIKQIGNDNTFTQPRCISINNKSELVVCDWSKTNCIKLFTKDGEYIKGFGKWGKGIGEFRAIKGVTFDFVNREYIISDSRNNRIQIMDEEGNFIKCFGKEGNNISEFKNLRRTLIDYSTGVLYVVDSNNDRIQLFK